MPALPAFPLTRRPFDARRRGRLFLSLVVLVAVSAAAALAYLSFPSAGRTSPPAAFSSVRADADCCRGMEGLELWGPAVKWGSDHRLPSAAACCAACKAMCPHPEDGACRCDSWVFCGDERKCKDRLGECWLKKQKDAMAPAVIARGKDVMWTSGLIFGKGEAEEQLIPIFHDKGMQQQALSSYVFIAANVILHSRQSVQICHLNQLLPPILLFLTSHHHSLRGFTQLLVHSVLSRLWPTLRLETSEDAVFETRCFEELKDYLAENSDCVRLRVSIEGFLDVFDPNASGTPCGIFSARPEVSDFECVPVSVMERVIEFLNDVREDLRHAIAKDTVTIKNEDLAVGERRNLDKSDESVSEMVKTGQDVLDFQKKITPHRDSEQALNLNARGYSGFGNENISRIISDMEEDDQVFNLALEARLHAAEMIKQSRQELIVVASFVDRIPNLAGLTRTCEVFRAAGLVVADKSVLEDKQFRLISITAEKWLPVTEVPVDSLKAYLERERGEGYSVIGLEQTAHSRPLDRFVFPDRTVLVLGREKEGIPVDIIHILDACVEIPQLGVVRSLNVTSPTPCIWTCKTLFRTVA